MTRTPWIELSLQVCFEETDMEVLVRGKKQMRRIATPVFLLPDGRKFTGCRIGRALRRRMQLASHEHVNAVQALRRANLLIGQQADEMKKLQDMLGERKRRAKGRNKK